MTKNKPIEKIIEDIRNDPEARKQARSLIGKNKPLYELSRKYFDPITKEKMRESLELEDVKTALENLKARLKKASEENNWEFVSGFPDLNEFKIISGSEYIDNAFKEEIGEI